MKIQELEIKNIRGIPYIHITPQEKNYIIFGPNGTGKSAIIDGLDFLLSGNISRLSGEGTGEISLLKHGTHISHKPQDAEVRAIVKIRDCPDSIELKRNMTSHATLEYDPRYADYINPVIKQAIRGQHILTRKELLKFIVAKPKTRSDEIQTLLNITEIEDVRKSLVKAKNSLNQNLQTVKQNVEKENSELCVLIQEKTLDAETFLHFINQKRSVLSSQPLLITQLNSQSLKNNVIPPGLVKEHSNIAKSVIENYLKNLSEVDTPENTTAILALTDEIRTLVDEIRQNPELVKTLLKNDLTNLGIRLIDETGACPLCDTVFPPGKLIVVLQQKLVLAEQAKGKLDRIQEISRSILRSIQLTSTNIRKICELQKDLQIQECVTELNDWETRLKHLDSLLKNPIEKYHDLPFTPDELGRLLSPNNLQNIVETIQTTIDSNIPPISPEQEAWDTLTYIEVNLKRYENALEECCRVETSFKQSEILLNSFLIARDNILEKLYGSVKNRFVELYKKLHESDEKQFKANITPDGAGLKFEVDFLNYGYFPPHALHSEGHQDSMGLCLFLALFEQLNEGILDVVILDDIVMSIDSEHRKNIGKILIEEFPDEQFFITTHDRVWKNQLRSDGVVNSQNILELYNWSLVYGPQMNCIKDDWTKIFESIENNDVPTASAKLRRGSEEFFTIIGESIGARVPLKTNGQWDLGEVLQSSMSRYSDLLKKAKYAAQSWNNKDLEKDLSTLDDYRKQVFKSTNSEQWAINPAVHYNNWENFSKADFLPVAESFQKLWHLFICEKCGSIIYTVKNGQNDENVRCRCSNYNWNLIPKK